MFEAPFCPKCGIPPAPEAEACDSCKIDVWCKYNASWRSNPFIATSMGWSRLGRRTANVFALAMVAILIFALYLGTRSEVEVSRRQLGGAALLLVFATYEVWAFAHGKRTSIDRYVHEAKPGNTGLRTFGLALDLALAAVALHFLVQHL